MELKSLMNEAWKLLSLGTLLGWLFLFIIVDKTHQIINLSAARNVMLELTPKFLDNEATSKTKPILNSNLLHTNSSAMKPNSSINAEHQRNHAVKKKCDMFDGRWVYNAHEIPRYNSETCPFLEEKMSCKRNGRPDFEYEKWRWEANDCDIPLFNGLDIMERLRNKRMIIVGDSLNRNMWESLACLLYTSISSSRVEVLPQGTEYKVLRAKDYNLTVEFYWSPFLIEFNKKHESGKNVLMLDKLSPNSEQWRGADIMVFNSGHWWVHSGKFKSWDLFACGEKLIEDMPIEIAFKRAMKTWAKWIKKNVNPKKTTVFFRSISAEHILRKYDQWCYNVTHPMINQSYVSVYPKLLVKIIENLIKEMSVNYLDITKLSEYRIDAHPSIYRSKDWKIFAKKFEDNLSSYADCSHWCLPGVPDTWNRLLYAFIISENSK